MDALNSRIKKARKNAGLTQPVLAEKIGVSLRTIKNYEKDSTNVTVDSVHRIALVCEVDEIWLLTGRSVIESNDSPVDVSQGNITIHPIVKTHIDIVQQFENKEAALSANKDLLELEKKAPKAFEKAISYIKGLKDGISLDESDTLDRQTQERVDRRKKDTPYNPDRRKQVS